jgi:hypothetical protein
MGEGFPIGPMKKELDALAKNTIGPEFLKEVLVRVGTAFEVITNVARDCEADLIIITTHVYAGLKHVFMGSTAERVVRQAPVSPKMRTRVHIGREEVAKKRKVFGKIRQGKIDCGIRLN